MRTPIVFLLVLSACASDERLDGGFSSEPVAPQSDVRDVSLRVNIIPSAQRETQSVDAAFRVLSQTVNLPLLVQGEGINLGEVELLEPVVQSGSVLAYRVNPSVAALPGEVVPVEALVRLRLPDTVQSYIARSTALGFFSAWAIPDTGYRFEIVPDDPLLPMYTTALDVSTDPVQVDLDLGPGVPIYGRVSSAATEGVAGARIHVLDAYGAQSATALTDAYGLYQIRVMPGTWTVVCEGGSSGYDPTLTFTDQVVGPTGLNLDVAYPTALVRGGVEGAIEDPDGDQLALATVRLTAESLDGYGPNASWTTDVFMGDIGFSSRVPPGFYTIEVLPPEGAGDDLSPVRFTEQRLGSGTTTLDPIRLGPKVAVAGTVSGPDNAGLGSVLVTCREIGFDQRSSTTFTGEQGKFTLDLPTVPVECEAQPPGNRPDLAIDRALLDPSQSEVPNLAFVLDAGRRISGRVVFRGDPEPNADVQVVDESGRILGIGLTGEDGTFSVAVSTGSDLPPDP